MNAKSNKVGVLEVVGAFIEESEKLYSVFGSYSGGSIEKGMLLNVSFNPSFAMSCEIRDSDYIGIEGKKYVTVSIGFEDDEELSMLKGLNIGGESCEVVRA